MQGSMRGRTLSALRLMPLSLAVCSVVGIAVRVALHHTPLLCSRSSSFCCRSCIQQRNNTASYQPKVRLDSRD